MSEHEHEHEPEDTSGQLDVDPVAAGETEPRLPRPADPTDPGSEGGDNGGA